MDIKAELNCKLYTSNSQPKICRRLKYC